MSRKLVGSQSGSQNSSCCIWPTSVYFRIDNSTIKIIGRVAKWKSVNYAVKYLGSLILPRYSALPHWKNLYLCENQPHSEPPSATNFHSTLDKKADLEYIRDTFFGWKKTSVNSSSILIFSFRNKTCSQNWPWKTPFCLSLLTVNNIREN